MENILIVKQVPDVAGFADVAAAIDGIAIGDLIAIGDGSVLLGGDSLAAAFATVQNIQFFTRLSNNIVRNSVVIPRRQITRYNYQTTTVGLPKIIRAGATGAGLGLAVPTTGEVEFVIKNLSYNHAIAATRLSASFTKKAAETVSAFLDRVVAVINAENAKLAFPFVTVAKSGGPDYALTFTAVDESVDLFIGISGFLEGSVLTVTQEADSTLGAAKDILAMEQDMSRHTGNHGYDTADIWYTQPTQTDASTVYNVATLGWDGVSPTPTNTIKVANNTMTFAVDNAADGGDITVNAFLRLVAQVDNAVDTDTTEENDTDAINNTAV